MEKLEKLIFPAAFLILMMSSLFPGFSQTQTSNEAFSKLSVEQGLSSVTVTCILRDSRGYLWAGTEDGLNRYNGYDFKIYRNDPSDASSLLRNRIVSLYEDSQQTLWISYGGGGLQFYDRSTDSFKTILDQDTIVVKKIKEDDRKRLWVVGSAVKSLDLVTRQWTDHSGVFPKKEQIVSIEQAGGNEFWVTSELALYKWNSATGMLKAFRHDPSNDNSLSYNSIYTSLLDNKGNLWIATRGGGLDKFNTVTNEFTHFRRSELKENGPLVNVIRSLCLDGNYLWLGTENGGLSKLDLHSNKFTHYTSDKAFPRGLNDNSIWSIYKDSSGSLWIGTFSFGICVIDPYQDKFSTLKLPLENSIVNSIFVDSKERLWIGTEGGVFLQENGSVSRFLAGPTKKSQNGIPVLTIYEDNGGIVWVGTWSDGVFRYSEKGKRFEHFASSGPEKSDLSNEHVYAIHQDSENNSMLIASFLGLNVLADPRKKEFLKVVDSTQAVIAPHNNLKTILEDSKGNIWVGTCNGLKLYDRESRKFISLFSNSELQEQHLSAIVFSLYEDRSGRLWAGTESGLYEIQSMDQLTRYTVQDGLSNHSIMGILEDERGHLWLSTSNGLTVFDPDTRSFRNYDASDGLFVNGFKPNACFQDKNGRFYFGGSDGVITFDPSKIVDNPNPPAVALEGFRIFNEPVKINGSDSILRQHINETREISLNYDANMFSLDFVALNFSASNKNKYAYRLLGFDKSWNYVGNSRSATYTNLDPGRYTFEVKAANNDGTWSTEPAQLSIVIRPPWWKTPIAYFVYAVAVVAMFYFFRKLILMRAQYINDLKLERIRGENIERLNQAKLEFFTNISHEFRTPLTLILGPVQNLIDSGELDDSVRAKLRTVKLNVNRLHRLVNQLLDFRKAESGSMKIVAMEADLVSFISELKLSFDHLAEEKKIDFKFSHPAEPKLAWFDMDHLEKVLFNLLSNAFKHTAEKGCIEIRLLESESHFVVEVEDNGEGIKQEHLPDIFKAFFSFGKNRNLNGTGIGLALSKSLVELHHGTLEVKSEEGAYSRFTVRLLKGNAHYKYDEIAPSFVMQHLPHRFDNNWQLQTAKQSNAEDIPVSPEKPTILVIENNLEICTYLQSILQPSYKLQIANNGKEALRLVHEKSPDLVLCDVMMPEMDGISFCRHLKGKKETNQIPLIFLTAKISEVDKIEGLELGASDYITKPFDPRILMLKIRNQLQMNRLASSDADSKFLKIEPSVVKPATKDDLFIKAALSSIEKNMENTEYTVNDLCHDVGMSKATLFRKLKVLTGQSANEFIRTIRLKRAAQLFSQNGFSVSEVAYKVGFNDPKYFRLCFKKQFKISPSEYAGRDKAGIS